MPLPDPPRPETSRGEVPDSTATRIGAVPFTPPLLFQVPASPPLTSAGTLFLNTKGVTFRPTDEDLKFRIGGRLQQDFSVADIRPGRLGPAVDDNTGTRRAFLEGYVTTADFAAAIQYDFNNPGAPINDGIVSYHGFGPFVLTVGNFIEPFSLNALESNDTTTFTERSLMNALAPQDAFGSSIGASGGRWTATIGVFGANVVPGPGTDGVAGTGRVTYAPILGKDQVLQFGIAGSYRALSAGDPAPSFSSTPEDSLFASTLVTAGALERAADIVRAGGEALYQVGSVRVQAEYDHVDVMGRDGQPTRAFQGGYVEGAWVVNGDGRPFSLKAPYGGYFALLQGLKVRDDQRISQGGFGVFEVAVRFSAIDLRSDGVRGGQEQDVTAGINWYPDNNIRVMADYVHARANAAAFQVGQGETVDSDIFVGRVNFYW